jgi:hypothetical protein
LAASFACGRGGWGNLERGIKKIIKILFTDIVGPYREIFLSVLKKKKYFSIRTSNPVNNIYLF